MVYVLAYEDSTLPFMNRREYLFVKKSWILLLQAHLIQVTFLKESILSNVQTAITALQMNRASEPRLLEVLSPVLPSLLFLFFSFFSLFST